ncbi:MAG: glycoside hydrolase family 3 C-terminal domain-containing protein [Pirellulales bacterium]|nr:glycoside hydrolase family 3 C-terminal domain-containing protein [Pirellulales bacterium]
MATIAETQDTPCYRNAEAPIPQRVADLLARMTLEEKAAQMICIWRHKEDMLLDQAGGFDADKARRHFAHGNGIGQIGRISDAAGGRSARETAVLTNAIQEFFIRHSRLRIPVFFHEECLHGLAGPQATSFPQPIGLAATFDPDLVRRLYAAIASEARSRGIHQALTPVVDVARDPRWGRVEETFGEDPYLVSRMGTAAVAGFQGDRHFEGKSNLVATLKHFAAHGQPESGNNCAPANVSERVLRETFLYPFQEAIQQAGALAVMASYNEIDGVPSHANERLLRRVLRDEWGFTGPVVSDYYAIRELAERPELYGHHVAVDGKEAALMAVRAGVSMELPEPDCYLHLTQLVREGLLSETDLDELVTPLLALKFDLGLFEDPYVNPDRAEQIAEHDEHRKLALEAARKTITLLKNDGAAPLRLDRIKSIAVIGPNANRELLGGYSGRPTRRSTVLEGIRQRVGGAAELLYHEGCQITIGGSWWQDEVVPGDPIKDRAMIAEAVEIARQADVVVLALGDNEQTSREAWALNHLGDRASLNMVGLQDELVDAAAATGKPMVGLVFGGRPLSIGNLASKASAVFQCWYLGQETGQAVAEVLFGDVNPSGKLPITFPRSVGHLPAYYNHKPSARRGYLFDDASPLFPFGFGLSYTEFNFSVPRLEQDRIALGESTRAFVDVANIGNRPGEAVVQLYIRDLVSSVTRPVKELKGFERIALEPGETGSVAFDISPDRLAFWNVDMRYVVEPGDFAVMTGPDSANLQTVTLHVDDRGAHGAFN